MKKAIHMRADRNIYFYIEAIRLLMSNDRGKIMSFMDASTEFLKLFEEAISWDTRGNKIFKEYLKVKKNYGNMLTQRYNRA
jgi:glycosyltransferase involved in cell wall biosynthesis